MLDAAEIRKEIARLEYEESDYKNYAKLADLYVIRKQMQEEERDDGGRYASYYSGAPPLCPQNRLPWASTGTVSFCLR